MGEIPWGKGGEQVWGWLTEHDTLDFLIVENYRIRPPKMTRGHANTWSESHESQIIGGARLHCWMNSIGLVIQEPSIKEVGYGYAGLDYKPNAPRQHKQDAIAHGSYWWMNHGRKIVVPQT